MPIDYTQYPANWKTEIVPKIRERSGDKCEWCGVPNNRWILRLVGAGQSFMVLDPWERDRAKQLGYRPVQIVLTTAHLDHDLTNNDGMDTGGPAIPLDKANLVHLCQKCHLDHDRDHHVAQRIDNRDKRRGQMRLPVTKQGE